MPLFNHPSRAFLYASLPLFAAIAGCSGNSSSSTEIPSEIITPAEINTALSAVEWDANNETRMASDVTRSLVRNAIIAAGPTGQLRSLSTLLRLLQVDSTGRCPFGGTMANGVVPVQCFEDAGDTPPEVACSIDPILDNQLVTTAQTSRANACQQGRYFDGYFNVEDVRDYRPADRNLLETRISNTGLADQIVDGQFVLDDDGNRVQVTIRDYQAQDETFVFFMRNGYTIYNEEDPDGPDNLAALAGCAEDDQIYLFRQGIRADDAGSYEAKAGGGFLFSRYTNLNLQSVPAYSCNGDILDIEFSHTLTSDIETVTSGGGDNGATQVDWQDMEIRLNGNLGGTLTLIHQNAGGGYQVVAEFDADTGTVRVTGPGGQPADFASASAFLNLSLVTSTDTSAEEDN